MADLALTALLSGALAGVVAIAVTIAIERFGGIVGGVLASSPTTIIPASIGLASRLSGDGVVAAMFSIPPGMLVNAGFLLVWRLLPPRLPAGWPLWKRLAAMITVSLSVWGVGAAVIVGSNIKKSDSVSAIVTVGSLCTAGLIATGLCACWTPPDAPKGAKKVTLTSYLLRGVAAFVAITTSVLLSRVNDVAAGFASTFPAIFLSTMVALWLSQGAGVPTGATGPMVLGSTSVSAYAVVFAGTAGVGGWSPYGAAAMSYVAAISVCSLPSALYLRWRRAVMAKRAGGGGGGGGANGVAVSPPETPSRAEEAAHGGVATEGTAGDDAGSGVAVGIVDAAAAATPALPWAGLAAVSGVDGDDKTALAADAGGHAGGVDAASVHVVDVRPLTDEVDGGGAIGVVAAHVVAASSTGAAAVTSAGTPGVASAADEEAAATVAADAKRATAADDDDPWR